MKKIYKKISQRIHWAKNFISVKWSNVLFLFDIKYSEDLIPNGPYCYVPDEEANKNKEENDDSYYIKPCPYYKSIGKGYNGCKYLGIVTDDFVFADQCKMCTVNKYYDDDER